MRKREVRWRRLRWKLRPVRGLGGLQWRPLRPGTAAGPARVHPLTLRSGCPDACGMRHVREERVRAEARMLFFVLELEVRSGSRFAVSGPLLSRGMGAEPPS